VLRHRSRGERLVQDAGEIDWFLALPHRDDVASATLSSAREQLSSWKVTPEYGWDRGVPARPPLLSVPDFWAHVAATLDAAGHDLLTKNHREALFGGTFDGVPAPGEPPFANLALRRTAGTDGTRFAAVLDGQELGHCEVRQDLTHDGVLPTLRGWADLWVIWV